MAGWMEDLGRFVYVGMVSNNVGGEYISLGDIGEVGHGMCLIY